MNWIHFYVGSFFKNPWQYKYTVPLLLVNALGSIYGYYWYWDQLTHTAKKVWLFVPDSPLATTLFSMVLVLSLVGFRNRFLELLALTANIKYGFWAVILITDFWFGSGNIRFAESMLWFSHLGMAAQGLIYLFWGTGRSYTAPVIIAVSGWMVLNDFLDYSLGIYPYLYYPGQFLVGVLSAGFLTMGLMIMGWTLLYRKEGKVR